MTEIKYPKIHNDKKGNSALPELWREVGFSVDFSLDGIARTEDAVNKVFTLLELRYGKQFHSAFSDEISVTLAKKLWLDCLITFDPDVILKGAHRIIRESPYVPVLSKMLNACREEG